MEQNVGEDREYWPSAPEREDDTWLSMKVILRLNKQRFWRGERMFASDDRTGNVITAAVVLPGTDPGPRLSSRSHPAARRVADLKISELPQPSIKKGTENA
jgi:hypothetical protein